MHAARFCAAAITWSLATLAFAQPAPPLSVTRGPGTGDCPDAAGLTARIEEIRKSPAPAEQPAYDVTFARDEHGVYAQITSVPTGAERMLTDTSPDCAALTQATAVTLALLFDADARARQELELAPAPAPAPHAASPAAPAPASAPASAPRDPADVHRFILSYEAGALLGVIAPIAFAAVAELGYAYGSWRVSLGYVVSLAPHHELGTGSVLESFGGGSLVGCYAPWRHALWRLDACTGVFLGSVQGEAYGFAEGTVADRGWFAPAVEARFGLLPDTFGAELRAALLAPTTRQDFAIDGVGTAYRSSPIALLLTLHLTWTFAQDPPAP